MRRDHHVRPLEGFQGPARPGRDKGCGGKKVRHWTGPTCVDCCSVFRICICSFMFIYDFVCLFMYLLFFIHSKCLFIIWYRYIYIIIYCFKLLSWKDVIEVWCEYLCSVGSSVGRCARVTWPDRKTVCAGAKSGSQGDYCRVYFQTHGRGSLRDLRVNLKWSQST